MTRRLLVCSALAATWLVAPTEARADVPTRGSFLVGAERMTGIYAVSYKHTELAHSDQPPGPNNAEFTVTDSGTMFNLLWNNHAFSGVANIQAVPRLAADYMITDIVSLGGSVGYFSSSGSSSVPGEPEQNTPTFSGFAFAPRVGFMFGLSSIFGIWPRVGGTLWSYKVQTDIVQVQKGVAVTTTERDSWSGFSVDADVTFVLAPIPHFGFTFGPLLSIPVSGSRSHDHIEPGVDTSQSLDAKLQNIGFTVGLLGWF